MNMDLNDSHVAVGGDFSRIFDPKDFLAMINIPDEALCVLRAHLILEEFLNLWSAKVTGVEDLYSGAFVSFKLKLVISKNLGLPDEFFTIINKINDIRNRFSHRKGHTLEGSMIDSLKTKVDSLTSAMQLQKCDDFEVFTSGLDQHGNRVSNTRTWKESDSRIKFLILFVIFMLKFTQWMQDAFNTRSISYEIAASPQSSTGVI